MARKHSDADWGELFTDILYEVSPEVFNSMWYEGISDTEIASELVEISPKLYLNVLDKTTEKARELGWEV